MAHITHVRLSGLLGRAKVIDLEMDRYINVFYGPNGCGKTSLLKVLNAAMSNETRSIRHVRFDSAAVRIFSLEYDKEFSYSYSKKENPQKAKRGDSIDSLSESMPELLELLEGKKPGWKISPSLPAGAAGVWAHQNLLTNRLLFNVPVSKIDRQQDQNAVEESLDELFADQIQRVWSTYFGKVLSEVKDSQAKAIENVFLNYIFDSVPAEQAPQISAEKAFQLVNAFLRRRHGRRNSTISESQFVQRFSRDKNLQRIASDIARVETQTAEAMKKIGELERLISSLFSGGKHISLSGSVIAVRDDTGAEIPLAWLSAGEKHLLRLFLSAINAGPNTLIIDEPELSLHIDWQRKLIASIRLLNPGAQLIVATHAPEVMAELADENIRSL